MTQSINSLDVELEMVHEHLVQLTHDLGFPLHDLVRSQIEQIQPYIRAAVVLAAGFGNPDSPDLQTRRVYLASALETLYLAFSIHQLLLESESIYADQSAKSLIGSMILAGDFCFSRSAGLAAQTENPEVVSIFAKALRDISEGRLQHTFGNDTISRHIENNQSHHKDAYNENAPLFLAGALAAAKLANLTEDEQILIFELCQQLNEPSKNHSTPTLSKNIVNVTNFPKYQQSRWTQALLLYTEHGR